MVNTLSLHLLLFHRISIVGRLQNQRLLFAPAVFVSQRNESWFPFSGIISARVEYETLSLWGTQSSRAGLIADVTQRRFDKKKHRHKTKN